jgi:hypothetical protein
MEKVGKVEAIITSAIAAIRLRPTTNNDPSSHKVRSSLSLKGVQSSLACLDTRNDTKWLRQVTAGSCQFTRLRLEQQVPRWTNQLPRRKAYSMLSSNIDQDRNLKGTSSKFANPPSSTHKAIVLWHPVFTSLATSTASFTARID